MTSKTERFVSLDVLRGLTILMMILVNSQGVGKGFRFLRHSTWDGCSVADMVYPFFLFIVGAAMYFSFKKFTNRVTKELLLKVFKRGFILFAIGFLLNILPFNSSPATWRIPGILQRTAFVYVIGALLVVPIKSAKKIALLSAVILITYWILLIVFGRDLDNNPLYPIDKFLFGESHLYVIAGKRFDPEGLAGSVPSLVNALTGYMAAEYLFNRHLLKKIPLGMLTVGVPMVIVALVWNMILPFNKPLWSSSFVLFTCGWAIIVWFLLYCVIDVWRLRGWAMPLKVFGSNALFAYLLSELLVIANWSFPVNIGGEQYYVSTWLDQYVFHPITDGPMRPALWGLLIVSICWVVDYVLYRKKILIKI